MWRISSGIPLFLSITALLVGAGCSVIANVDHDKCSTSEQCRTAFGLGWTCAKASGLCVEPEVPARCEQTYPEDLFEKPKKYESAVVLGHLMDRSSETHVRRERSSRLAAVQIEDEGGLEGRPVAMVFCTYEQNPTFDELQPTDAAIAGAKYLSGVLGVPAIIGPAGSADTERVFEELRGSNTLVISPSATSPALTGLEAAASDDAPGLLWRTAFPDSLQGKEIAGDMTGRNITRAFVVYQKGAYGEGLLTEFRKNFLKDGTEVETAPFETVNQRNDAVVQGGADAAAEVLFISSAQPDVIAFLTAVKANTNYDKKGLFLTDSAASKDVIDKSPPEVFPRVRGTRPAPVNPTDPVYALFKSAYSVEYEGEDVSTFVYAAHTYDAAWMVFYGSAWSELQEGGITGTGIAKGLRKISAGAPVNIQPLTWNGAVQSFRSGSSINVKGASGELDYDPVTEETTGPIEVWHIVPMGAGNVIQAIPKP